MNLDRRPQRPQMAIRKPVFFVVFIALLLLAGCVVYVSTKPASHYQAPAVLGQSPHTSPGQKGNPGDLAKQAQSSGTPTPSPQTSSASTIAISGFSVSASGGTAHTSDYVSGANNANCTLTLTSPDNKQNKTLTGETIWAGQYYDCAGFGSISGVTEAGTWQAALKVNDSSTGATGTATTEFNVGG
jgi:hypothetical protein